ncbi:MAG: IPT/TIG domain-containing protein, partial [Cytophagales bacterium]|nr:IPT/TIG domain-containing protein [Cytophagales bacterium]
MFRSQFKGSRSDKFLRLLAVAGLALVGLFTTCRPDEDLPPPVPVLTAIAPDSAFAGDTVIITGTGFSTEPIDNVIMFDTVEAYALSATETQLRVRVPRDAVRGPVTVGITLQGQPSNALAFGVLKRTVEISEMTPTRGSYGTTVTITINGVRESEDIEVYFGDENNEAATVSGRRHSAGVTTLTVRVPEGAVTGAVILLVSRVNQTPLRVEGPVFTIAPPTIDSFSPVSGRIGQEVTINGTNFSPTVTQVTIGGTRAPVRDVSSNGRVIRVTIPPLPAGEYPFVARNREDSAVSRGRFRLEAVAAGTIQVYYTDASAIFSRTVSPGGQVASSGPTVVGNTGGDSPLDFVVDTASNMIYWTRGNEIRSRNLNSSGENEFTRLYTIGTNNENQFGAVTMAGDRLYWTDAYVDGNTTFYRIVQGNTTGSNRSALIDRRTSRIFDVAVAGDYIYWTEGTRVMRRSLDGGEPVPLFDIRGGQPMGLAVAGNRLYVTNNPRGTDNDQILVGNLSGGSLSLLFPRGTAQVANPWGLAVFGNFIYGRTRQGNTRPVSVVYRSSLG